MHARIEQKKTKRSTRNNGEIAHKRELEELRTNKEAKKQREELKEIKVCAREKEIGKGSVTEKEQNQTSKKYIISGKTGSSTHSDKNHFIQFDIF